MGLVDSARVWVSAMAAIAATAICTATARGSYTYSTNITILDGSGSGVIINAPGTGASFTTAGGTTVTLSDILTPGTFAIPSISTINIGKISVSTTAATPQNFFVSYVDNLVITNGSATDSLSINGTLTFTGIETVGGSSGGTVSNQYGTLPPPPDPIGGTLFTVTLGDGRADEFFGPPTINDPNAAGSFGAVVATPEPTGLCLAGMAGAGLLRRRRK